ncbi:FAD-binding protein [Acidisphaera sp. L21]|uniref:FAD-binding protein n=1 Tax=Acidisphaera sp. L21 TaxID=1641851 RepID=UPI00131BC157|nr:FAD-binding protein [Acidisphaera sp. L21]
MSAPATEAALAEAIADAYAAKEPVLVQGAGTKHGMLRPVQAARSLSTRNLSGITLYAPKELVISARAGTPITEIKAALAEHGQHLTAEPPDLSDLLGVPGNQTLGGIVATNLSGPRRIVAGAMRDQILGIRAVDGTGEIFHSGGRVLKNVTGLDLCKLLSGSHGTLGIMTEITLKILPAPEQTGTLVIPGLDATAAVATLSAALGSPYGVSGAAWLPPDAAARIPELAGFNASVALMRIEEFAASVTYRTARLAQDLQPHGRAELLGDTISRSVWRSVRDVTPLTVEPGEAVWRVSVRPSAGPGILAATGLRGFLDWGGGLVWLVGDPASHPAVTAAATAAKGIWTLMHAPDSLRASADVIPPEPPVLAAIGRRVKAVMDPAGILNPGRMAAGA